MRWLEMMQSDTASKLDLKLLVTCASKGMTGHCGVKGRVLEGPEGLAKGSSYHSHASTMRRWILQSLE